MFNYMYFDIEALLHLLEGLCTSTTTGFFCNVLLSVEYSEADL